MKTRIILAVLMVTLALAGCCSNPEPLTVYLVRHAEKVDDGHDPKLTAAGMERAETLARNLGDAGIRHIHSSDYFRTRDTAAPAAAAWGLEVQLYDPRDLPALVEKLHSMGGTHLVVGHSNTTPEAVGLLGGDPGPEIEEATEYDRLYVVTVGQDGTADTVMVRYGERYGKVRQL
jgi:phosphohistidine phosphatase SixA